MIRDSRGTKEYWDKWVNHKLFYIQETKERLIREPSKNPDYEPQFVFELVNENLKLMLRRYSRGDSISELKQYFPPLLDYWEKSEDLAKEVWDKRTLYTRHTWKVNLDFYIKSFWLVSLALVLEIPEDQWQRLLKLIGNEGEDELLDRVIASRQIGRKIGKEILHPKPYQRLLNAINAPKEKQTQMLFTFVNNWYKDLKKPDRKNWPKDIPYDSPYWYGLGDRNFEGGGYFGRWCLEAVAAVKAFGLDDSKCLGHEHYPGDFLRPNSQTTHKAIEEVSFSPSSRIEATTNKLGFWSRLFHKKIMAARFKSD